MLIEPTGIDGLSLIRWEPATDCRGSFSRLFCRAELEAAGLPFRVAEAYGSHNAAAHTLRGMHYQRAPHGQAKIVFCVRGRLWDAVADMRTEAGSHREWRGFELAADRTAALHIAAGLAHGYLTLEAGTDVFYLIDGRYVPEAAAGFRWDDPAIAIEWPAAPEVILPRDLEFPPLERTPFPEPGGPR